MSPKARTMQTDLVTPNPTPAGRLAELFQGLEIGGRKYRSGFSALAAALSASGHKYDRRSVTRWTWPKNKGGTGGLIPTRAIADILKAARLFGIIIPEGFMDPRTMRARKVPMSNNRGGIPPEAQGLLE